MQYGAAFHTRVRTGESDKSLAFMFNAKYSRMNDAMRGVKHKPNIYADKTDRTLTAALLHRPMSEWGDAYRQYKSL